MIRLEERDGDSVGIGCLGIGCFGLVLLWTVLVFLVAYRLGGGGYGLGG